MKSSHNLLKGAVLSFAILYFFQPVYSQNSQILRNQSEGKNHLSDFRRQQEKLRKQKIKEIFTTDRNQLSSYESNFESHAGSPRKSHLLEKNTRVAGSAEKLYLGYIREDFSGDKKTYENSYAYRYVYESEQTVFEYYLEPDQDGKLTDTIKYEYYSKESVSNRNTYFYRYTKVGNEMILTDYSKGLKIHNNSCGTYGWFTYDELHSSTVETDWMTGDKYISRNNHSIVNGDTTTISNYSFTPSGDTTYIFHAQYSSDRTISLTYIFKNEDGTINGGTRSFETVGENNLVISFTQEVWNLSEQKWEVNYIETYSYDENENLASEEINIPEPYERYDYTYENDKLKTRFKYNWDSPNAAWLNFSKEDYTYKEDTLIIEQYKWEASNGEWVDDFITEEITSVDGENQKNITNIMKAVGINSYEDYQKDTVITNLSSSQMLYYSNHSWNGVSFELIEKEVYTYDDNCRMIYEAAIRPGQSTESYYRYENPGSPSRITSIKEYYSHDTEITNGITWSLKFLSEQKYEGDGENAVITKNETYLKSSQAGTKYEYAYNENQDETKINYFISEDPNPDDGIDYWLANEVSYTYDEDGLRTDWLFKKRNSKIEDLTFFQKAEYTNNVYGTDYILGYEYINDAWIFSDSSFYEYDANGYNTEYKREFYENDEIVDGYINIYIYAPAPFNEFCDISIAGDTILESSNTVLTALLGDGEDAFYQWKNSEGTLLSESDKLLVDEEGDYSVYATNEGCLVNSTSRVYSICPLNIIGDTVLIGAEATLTAQLVDHENAAYQWKSEENENISEGASMTTTEAGIYTVTGIKDFCFAEASKEVKVITNLYDELENYKINIFPNPSYGLIHVSNAESEWENATIRLFNMQGKLVYNQQLISNYEYEINLQNIYKGLYVLKLTTGDRTESMKIVLK